MKEKPKILGDYFKWRHNPSKGDSIASSEFGDEVWDWWLSIQPTWRYKDDHPPDDRNYSYILAGGKKGVFLLILCLAWWDCVHGRNMAREKAERREAARAAGKDETTLDFSDIPNHESKWFNLVNDLTFVLELATGWPVPGECASGAIEVVPARRKRTAEVTDTSSRKKQKSS